MDEQIEARLERLSARERQVLWLVNEPMNSSEIGRALGGISPNTVNHYAATGCRKLGVNDRRAASRLVRASPNLRALLNDWLGQTLGEVGAAAVVLQEVRRSTAPEPVHDDTPSHLDAGGGRGPTPDPCEGLERGDDPAPGGRLETRPARPDLATDPRRAPERDRRGRAVGEGGVAVAEPWGGVLALIPRPFRAPAQAAAGLLFVLLLLGGLYLLTYALQLSRMGPR